MGMPRKIKNFDVFQNGGDWRGQVAEVNLPKLSRKLEEWRGGGMNAAVDVDLGMEKLEAELTFGGYMYDVLKEFGITKVDGVQLRFAGAAQADDTGAVDSVEVVMRGRYTEIDPGGHKSGDDTEFKVKASIVYYKLSVNGEVLIDVDVLSMIENVGGVDRLAEQRRAIGWA